MQPLVFILSAVAGPIPGTDVRAKAPVTGVAIQVAKASGEFLDLVGSNIIHQFLL